MLILGTQRHYIFVDDPVSNIEFSTATVCENILSGGRSGDYIERRQIISQRWRDLAPIFLQTTMETFYPSTFQCSCCGMTVLDIVKCDDCRYL